MFDFVRKHTKIMQFVLFLLIVPSFVLFGLDGYTRFKDQGIVVARVDGRDIFQNDWDAAHKTEADRIRQSMPNIDAKMLDSPEVRYATLERLVRDKVMSAAAERFRLTASNARLARELQESPDIAGMRKPDGSLDMERYRQYTGQRGLSPEGYEAQVRADISSRQVFAGVGGTGLNLQVPADLALNAYFQRREIQVARFDAREFRSRVTVSDDDIEAFYKGNPTLFQTPEQANIEYVLLDLEAVKNSIVLNEADLKTYYTENSARLASQEERRASHILIASSKDASAADKQKARDRAEAIAAAVR